jgi:hypothetical protein
MERAMIDTKSAARKPSHFTNLNDTATTATAGTGVAEGDDDRTAPREGELVEEGDRDGVGDAVIVGVTGGLALGEGDGDDMPPAGGDPPDPGLVELSPAGGDPPSTHRPVLTGAAHKVQGVFALEKAIFSFKVDAFAAPVVGTSLMSVDILRINEASLLQRGEETPVPKARCNAYLGWIQSVLESCWCRVFQSASGPLQFDKMLL